jgi:hypothetical protein
MARHDAVFPAAAKRDSLQDIHVLRRETGMIG